MPLLVIADFVGLDVHKAIVENLYNNTNDYVHDTYILPDFLKRLIKDGNLGRKTGAGLYKTVINDSGVKSRYVYDIVHGYYREQMKYKFPFAEEMIAADDVMAMGFQWCPPLAMLEAINTVANFEELCVERLEEKIVDRLREQELLYELRKSDYDFRRFVLAK